jgi:SAM-dependent methyltransferase
MKTIKSWVKVFLLKYLSIKAKAAFNHASKTPEWLDFNELEKLKKEYPVKKKYEECQNKIEDYYTNPDFEKADILLSLVEDKSKKLHFLEMGCQHGMLSYALTLRGHKSTGVDVDTHAFNTEAKEHGVEYYFMDACELKFPDETFDFIVSYNAFEHMHDPEKALKEAMRVVKKGGYIYLNFNPLYMSPWGLHSWYELAIPYCQMLFPPDMIRDVVEMQDLWGVNGWSCQAYRDLWKKYENQLSIVKNHENVDPFHLNMVARYPSCFRSKTDCFDDLVVDGIEVLFQKK